MKITKTALYLTAILMGATSGAAHASTENDPFRVCEAEINQQFDGEGLRIARKKINTRGSTVKIRYRVTNAVDKYRVQCVVSKGQLASPLAIRSASGAATKVALQAVGAASE